MDLLESSHQPDMFIRSRKKDSCPRPNAVDGSLIYKGNADLPMKNQQSDSSTRFPHGTEVRFDCLRTALDEEVILDEEGDYLETEENVEENVDDGYLEDENYDEYPDVVDNDQDVYNFRKKRAIRAKTNKRKKSRKNSNRRRNKNRSGDNEDGTDDEEETDSYGNQISKEDAIEDMLKKEKYRSWKIVCNDGKWIGKSLGCDENGNPLLDDEAADVDYNPFNASCPYVKTPGDNIVAFHGDREVTEPQTDAVDAIYKEYFEPGAELIYRCRDIGMKYNYFFSCDIKLQ